MQRDVIKINLKLLNTYKQEIDSLFEQILVLQELLENDDIYLFEYSMTCDKLGIKTHNIIKPTELLALNQNKRITKDSVRETIYYLSNRLNRLILLVESIENVYCTLNDDYKIVFELSFKNDFYDKKTKLKIFNDHLNVNSNSITNSERLKKKFENIKHKIINVFIKNNNIIELMRGI